MKRTNKFNIDTPFTLQWWMFVQSKIIKMAFKESWKNIHEGRKPWDSDEYDRLQKMAYYIGIRILNDYEKKSHD